MDTESEEFIRLKQAYSEEKSKFCWRDRIRTFMKLGKPPLGSAYLEDPTKTNWKIVQEARRRGEIPKL